MRYIFLLLIFFLTSACTYAKEPVYKIDYIPFDVDFFTATDYTNFDQRVEKKFEMSSKVLDQFFKEETKCKTFMQSYEPRIRITDGTKRVIFITSSKTFIWSSRFCNFDNEKEKKVITEIENKAKTIKK